MRVDIYAICIRMQWIHCVTIKPWQMISKSFKYISNLSNYFRNGSYHLSPHANQIEKETADGIMNAKQQQQRQQQIQDINPPNIFYILYRCSMLNTLKNFIELNGDAMKKGRK